ncbi:hypothetical protein [Streptomyces sp. MMBL 11-1]|uniref:hypothetical protein n=1 Tax=Streptomyces sp. MMBL 11-1 TaxID=3026420 RepID=UPI0023600901|nr:hypothetical protein [Streptomyces sp. MMBL 11-1]
MHGKKPVRRYTGARIHVGGGRARLLAGAAPEVGMVVGRFSVISPGTERRHLGGPDREAGYMTLGRADDSGGWVLAPVPHGAAFDPACPGAVTAPAGMDPGLVALARFQQMACLGLDRVPTDDLSDVVVVGSGPVALGCVLELSRRGATGIRVVTARRHAAIGRAPGVIRVPSKDAGRGRLVIDAAGAPASAATLTAPGGILGLLGTPADGDALGALQVHRGGWSVVGMHELAPGAEGAYQAAFTTACHWLTGHLDPALATFWCRTVPGDKAPELFALLDAPGRPAEPVLLLDWRSA